MTAYPQLSSVIISHDSLACWTYPNAVILVNAGIRSMEYADRLDNMRELNDSLFSDIRYANSQIILMEEMYELCDSNFRIMSKMNNNLEEQLKYYEKANKELQVKNKIIIGAAIVASFLSVIFGNS